MASFVRPIAARSSFAGGGSGAEPQPLTTRWRSNFNSCSLWSAVSTLRATTCSVPAMLRVGATSSVSSAGSMPHFAATSRQTSSVGSLPLSSTPTQAEALSRYFRSSNNGSRAAAARIGPEPIAKNFSPFTSHPAYCDAMQASSG